MYNIFITITLLVMTMYLCLHKTEVMTGIQCTLCSWYRNFPFFLYLFFTKHFINSLKNYGVHITTNIIMANIKSVLVVSL